MLSHYSEFELSFGAFFSPMATWVLCFRTGMTSNNAILDHLSLVVVNTSLLKDNTRSLYSQYKFSLLRLDKLPRPGDRWYGTESDGSSACTADLGVNSFSCPLAVLYRLSGCD